MATLKPRAPTDHIRKRPFQPSITSYFTARHHDHDGRTVYRPAQSPLAPPLPQETQASLLNVGMRVRKAVPEGYKTHKTLGVASPMCSSTAAATSKSALPASVNSPGLVPFCGLHKTGDLAIQDAPSTLIAVTMPGPHMDDDDSNGESVPGLTLSQSTLPLSQDSFTSTTAPGTLRSKKRAFEDEVEDEFDAFFVGVEAQDTAEMESTRPMAQLKTRVKTADVEPIVNPSSAGGDFDEAGFLAPMEIDGEWA